MTGLRAVLIVLAALTGAAGTAAALDWRTYTNPRFGTTIDYPADVFELQPPPTNGDGRRMHGHGGQAVAWVFGAHNIGNHTPAQHEAYLRETLAYDRITYRAQKDNWLVLSGFRDGDIFYRRVEFGPGRQVLHTFEMFYPAALKNVYDPILARMSKSFRHR